MIDLRFFGRRRLPFVAASALNECGLACLAAVSEYFRGELGLPEIRQLSLHSGRGETLLMLRNLAERIGLSARAVRVSLNSMMQLSQPAILHWDMNHFVVLERVGRHGIIIMDPAAGRRILAWHEVDKSFTGIALELKTSDRWRRLSSKPRRVNLSELLGPLPHWRTDFALIVALSVMLEALVLITPLQMRLSVDTALQAADHRLIWVLAGGFTFVVLIQCCLMQVRSWSVAVFSTRAGFDMYERFVRALHGKSARFFLRHHSADILNRSRSMDSIQMLITTQSVETLLNLVMSLAMVVMMFLAIPTMALLVVGFTLVSVSVVALLKYSMLENSRRALRANALAEALFLENARAARTIKLFGKEMVRISVWGNRMAELANLRLAGSRLTLYSSTALQLTNNLGQAMLIAVGTSLVLDNSTSLGTMMMFFIFSATFTSRLNSCMAYMVELRRVRSHAERVEEIFRQETVREGDALRSAFVLPPSAEVGIVVKDLWFRYGDDAPWLLQEVSFAVRPGESLAISGPSGSGKTTLMHLLLGLLEPSRGEILINGRNLQAIDPADYAQVIGAVLQDDMLFQGTIADNIAFFDAPLDMERVVQAARKANVARDIEAMPMQYYSLLAEDGQDISGGQKQRLFIARAIYHDPKILFLDEATSHLDSANEQLVSEAIRSMQMTRVLIAHRQETLATADRVLLLSRAGTLIECRDPKLDLAVAVRRSATP